MAPREFNPEIDRETPAAAADILANDDDEPGLANDILNIVQLEDGAIRVDIPPFDPTLFASLLRGPVGDTPGLASLFAGHEQEAEVGGLFRALAGVLAPLSTDLVTQAEAHPDGLSGALVTAMEESMPRFEVSQEGSAVTLSMADGTAMQIDPILIQGTVNDIAERNSAAAEAGTDDAPMDFDKVFDEMFSTFKVEGIDDALLNQLKERLGPVLKQFSEDVKQLDEPPKGDIGTADVSRMAEALKGVADSAAPTATQFTDALLQLFPDDKFREMSSRMITRAIGTLTEGGCDVLAGLAAPVPEPAD